MKKSSILTTIFLLVLSVSCKKDKEIDPRLNAEPFIPEFSFSGTIIDHKNDVVIPFVEETDETVVMESTSVFGLGSFVGSVSGVGNQSGVNKKFIVASTGKSPNSILSFGANEDIMLFTRDAISVKVVSDSPPETPQINGTRPFSRAEVVEMFQEGSVLPFGTNPFEVEVGFHLRPIAGNPEFSEQGYLGFSMFHPDNSDSTFEILSVEEYDNPDLVNESKGFVVTALINCNLGFAVDELMSLQDVEVVFIVLYS